MRPATGMLLAGLLATNAAVGEAPANELTAFGGYRIGGSFEVRDAARSYEVQDSAAYGVIFNRGHRADTLWEVMYSRQATDAEADAPGVTDARLRFDLQSLEVGGVYLWQAGGIEPYLALTLGGTHVSTRARARESDTFVSGSLGLGLRLAPNSRLGARLEARYHAALTDKDTDLFCRTGPDANVCAIRVEGRLLGQFAAFAGITVRF